MMQDYKMPDFYYISNAHDEVLNYDHEKNVLNDAIGYM